MTVKYEGDGIIYFARPPKGGPTKVGISNNLRSRIAILRQQHFDCIEIVAQAPGRTCDEALLHRRLARFRINGEWYRENPELDAIIAHVIAHGELPADCVAPLDGRLPPPKLPAKVRTTIEGRKELFRLLLEAAT